ncbi:hypothetical protein [Streptomyces paludis]|uniref:Uncharacterized protein n=1 Tax=Streptomyces paludis TaxID=2282738 RepID=A0A345HP08_9ACTN|nr:hypothetical protein [Streptomyces paludis]AXG78432.1 hypothetical protein DVK44_12735 [Streptomyces paludis]
MPPIRNHRAESRRHRATTTGIALAGTVVLSASTLLSGAGTGTSWADSGTTAAASAAAPATAAPGTRGAELATGERVDVIDGSTGTGTGTGSGSGSNIRITPGPGRTMGRYAFASTDGDLSVRPVDVRQPVATTEIPAAGNGKPASAAKAGAAAGPYTVKMKVDGENSPGSLFRIWNSKTWASYSISTDSAHPSASIKLPPGDYFSVVLVSEWKSPDYLLVRTFKVTTAALTVGFERKKAKETGIRTDQSTAVLDTSSVWISVPGGDVAGFAGGGRRWDGMNRKVYVTPFSQTGASLWLHEIQVKKGSADAAPSPYRYDLTHSFKDTVPASPVKQVRTANLAKTVTAVRAPGTGRSGYLFSAPDTGGSGAYIGSAVPLGGSVTEYVTPGMPYSRMLSYDSGGHSVTMPDRTLKAGTSAGETLGTAPFQPDPQSDYSGSVRRAATIQLYEPYAFSDAEGHSAYDSRAKVSYRLAFRGQTLAEAKDLGALKTLNTGVPSGSGMYELVHTADRKVPYSRLSTQVRSEWTFASAAMRSSGSLPLVDTALTVSGLDARNTAKAAPVTVTATASTRTNGFNDPYDDVSTVTGIEYSTDDGANWHGLPLQETQEPQEPGETDGSSASATLPVPANASFVSLRVTAANKAGGTVRRTVTRAFMGPAPQTDQTVGATMISKVVINGGKPLTLHNDPLQSFTARFTATDPSGIADGDLYLYRGAYNKPDAVVTGWPATCKRTNATTSVCDVTFGYLDPVASLGKNALAGTWKAAAWARSADGQSLTDRQSVQTVQLRRHSRATVAATPKPVKKGKTLTVTGKLSLLNLENPSQTHYVGHGGQSVKLQFRKKGSSEYTNVKTVKADSAGKLKTTVKGTKTGHWRFSYAGSSIASAVNSSGVSVVVK